MSHKPWARVEPAPASPAAEDEPLLRVRPPFYLRRRFLHAFAPVGTLALVGLVALLVSGNLLLPFGRLVTLEGKMGSKADFFDDEQVRQMLLKQHLRVHTTRMGSRDAATSDLDSTDFVFPSGQPTALLVAQQRRRAGRYNIEYRPFVSPIVLATYREYAETLRRNGVATAQPTQGVDPLYYDLDLAKFLDLVRQRKTWDQLGIRAFGFSNGNRALVQSPSPCAANSGATYLGLVAYTTRGRVPTTEQDAVDFATEIKPLLREQGLSTTAPTELYFVPEGRQTAPIIVLYEHQYLAHQLQVAERSGMLDHDRVLLYPSVVFETQPEFIALTADGDRLGHLLITDPQLRRRALELGFRVLDSTGANSSEKLSKFLTEHRMPVPTQANDTKAVLPEAPLLEKMISVVGDCPVASLR
jgi:hypothetical protein